MGVIAIIFGESLLSKNRPPGPPVAATRSAARFVLLTQRLHRFRGGGPGTRTQQAKPIAVRSPPRCL